MKKLGGTVNIKSIIKSRHTAHFLKPKAPACNCFITTTNNSFGTTSVATQQLLTDCVDRLTRFSVQHSTYCCWLNGQMLASSNSN